MIQGQGQVVVVEETVAQKRLDLVLIIFQRLIALVLIGLTLLFWLRLVGFWPGEGMRFDLMATPLRIYTVLLAVIFPIASVGMWTTLPWGRVFWFMAALIQITAYFLFRGQIDVAPLELVFHMSAIALYLVLAIAAARMTKKA